MIIYNVLGRIIRTFFQLFYKRIYITGIENIPKDKPIFFAANHSNALIDGFVVAIFLIGYRTCYFLGRASIFGNKILLDIVFLKLEPPTLSQRTHNCLF